MSAGAIGGLMNALGSTTAASETGKKSGAGRFGELGSDEFIKILMTELTNQDPLSPNDSKAILEQLSSLRNIEGQLSLQESLESLVSQNQIAQAGGLIGKSIEGLDTENKKVNGIVTSVRIVDGAAVLELDSGKSLPMDRVTNIANKPVTTTPPPTGGAGTGQQAAQSGVDALLESLA